MAKNSNLHAAKTAKNDEFYTTLQDVEKELFHYREHFRDKTVLLNCDDPKWSAFWRYFHLCFKFLGLKKLISTHYEPDGSPSYALIYENPEGIQELDNDVEIGTTIPLKGNGDFRSPECIEFLKEADIVVTNPPFSLFREYVAQLVEYGKQFLIIGNKNAITYKEVFPLIKDGALWLGIYAVKEFRQTDGTIKKFGNIGWFTNLEHKKRHEPLILWREYAKTPEMFPRYDNYDAINVDKVCDIPIDYDGVMGVPITFLDKWNPEQFEIVELGNSRDNFTPNKDYVCPKKHLKNGTVVSGGAINCVLAIEYDTAPVGIVYYTSENSKYLVPPYARILIRRRKT